MSRYLYSRQAMRVLNVSSPERAWRVLRDAGVVPIAKDGVGPGGGPPFLVVWRAEDVVRVAQSVLAKSGAERRREASILRGIRQTRERREQRSA